MSLNYSSYLRTFEAPSDKQRDHAALYGYAAFLMNAAGSHRDKAISSLCAVIEPAIQQKRIKFYFNEDGNVVGYIVWALLAEDAEKKVRSTAKFALHESEWNEGDRLWIVDFLVPFGSVKYVMRDLSDNVFKTRASIKYMRKKNGKILLKQMDRNNRMSFFREK